MKLLFFLTSIGLSSQLSAQPDSIYLSMSSALKNPDKVYQLDLSKTNHVVRDMKRLGELRKLEYLNLSFCNLTEIPKQVLYCEQLKCLNLSSNSITELPDEISEFQVLEELNLRSNNLVFLSEELGLCSALVRLDLSGNRNLEVHSSQFWGLNSLTALSCKMSQKVLVEASSYLNNLETLKIYSDSSNLICDLVLFPRLKEFKLVLLSEDFVPFNCSLAGLSNLKRFCVETSDCCWPYIDLKYADQDSLQKLLPEKCQVSGFVSKSEEIRSDIELR